MTTCFKLAGIAVSAALLLATSAAAQTAPYVRTAIVSPTPGNANASGTTLLTTIAGLSPAPSVTNRWLVKIEPGLFDIGTTPMQMVDYVDYEGSGPLATVILGNVGPTAVSDDATSTLTITTLNQGVVRGANNSELRDLTIQCVPSVGQPACMGMINDTVSPKVTNVRIQITAGSAGGHWAMRNYNGSPTLNGLDIYIQGANGADNYGIVNVQSSPGTAIPTIKNSQIVVGGPNASNNWAVLNRGNAKMPIAHTNITASGGGTAAAVIHNSGGGATGSYYIENSSLVATAATTSNHGIDTSLSFDTTIKPIVFSSRVRGDTVGIKIGTGASATVSDGQLYGGTYAVDGGTVYIGGTWIQGGTVNAAAEFCASVWNNAFTLYATTCP